MCSFKSISRPSLNNKGGLTRLLLADVDDVLNDRIRVVRGTGYVNEPIVLQDGLQWLEVEFTPKSLKIDWRELVFPSIVPSADKFKCDTSFDFLIHNLGSKWEVNTCILPIMVDFLYLLYHKYSA